MTLIMGVNLSDRLYLAADTRVTYVQDYARIHTDYCLKLVPLAPHVTVATAGRVHFVKHLLRALQASVTISLDDGAVLREQLLAILNPAVDAYLAEGHTYEEASACLLFGCLAQARRKRVRRTLVTEMLRAYHEAALRSVEMLITKLLDPTFAAFHPSIAAVLAQGPRLRPALLQGLQAGADGEDLLTLPTPDGLVFAARIAAPGAPVVHDASWGRLLAFGTGGLRDDAIAAEAFAKLEFTDPLDLQANLILLAAIVDDVARGRDSIGGGVVASIVAEFGTGVLMGGVGGLDPQTAAARHITEVVGDPPRGLQMRSSDGSLHRLVPVSEWSEHEKHLETSLVA